MKLKINFVDFWPNFNKKNNYFYHLLKQKYDIYIDDEDPDILFFSVDFLKKKERNKYTNHRCKKVFFSGENVRANFSNFDVESDKYSIGKCDYAFTFDFINHPKHYRLPLWVMYIDWFNVGGYDNPQYLIHPKHLFNNNYISKKKDNFCCIIISNPEQRRIELFNKLNKYKKVDGYGSVFNKSSVGEKNKYEILSNYKFSICLENSISPYGGYYTEKLLHAKTAGTIPIYWSDSKCSYDFNNKCFLNLNDYSNMDDFVEHIISVDKNDNLYTSYFQENLFKNNSIGDELLPNSVLKFFEEKILC